MKEVAPALTTIEQREEIQRSFQSLGVVDTASQLGLTYELTGQRITSVAQLEARHAHVLKSRLRERLAAKARPLTGNSWDDRNEDTWIDKL